jgi:transcriptional regulator with XRE-family HTH domain
MASQNGPDHQQVGVGERLRVFRKERGLSIRVLADRAGLSPNTISLIENNAASPMVSTLQTIANVLEIPISAFFIEDDKWDEVLCIRAQDRERTLMPGVKVSVLPETLLDRRVHVLHFSVEAGRGSGSDQMVHVGDELVICTQGELDYQVKDTVYRLKANDSLAFKGNLPHSWHNPGKTETHFFVLITTEAAQSFRFHFLPFSTE